MNKRFTRILATSITAAALIGSLGACGKGSASATSEGANEITLWTHNAGNPEELAAIEGIVLRCSVPIIVGGSGLYVASVVTDFRFPGTDPDVRARWESVLAERGLGHLVAELQRRDPEAAAAIDPHNARRVIRALEIGEVTGEGARPGLAARSTPWRPYAQLGLAVERAVLVERLDARVGEMWRAGLLDEVAARAAWDSALPDGHGRGIAIVESFGTIVAEVVEVMMLPDGRPKVLKAFAVVDCGTVVNPLNAEAQIAGGLIMGLSAAMGEAITLEKGAVVESNFTDYPLITLADAPAEVDVHFINSGAKMGGIGEPGVPPASPALGNAIAAASGKRIRTLPIMAQITA